MKKKPRAKTERQIAAINAKKLLFERARKGDPDALAISMFNCGMCNKDQLSDYFKIKKECEGADE